MELQNPKLGYGSAIKMAADPYLSPTLEELIARICQAQSLSPPDYNARLFLNEVGEAAALRILTGLASRRIRNLSAYIIFMCKNSEIVLARNAESIATQESACCSGPPTPRSPASRDGAAGEATSPARVMPQAIYRMPPCVSNAGNVMKALGDMEFRKAFLILSYCGGNKMESFVSEDLLNRIKNFPMVLLEGEAWKAIGRHCIRESERRKNVDWDSGKPHTYHCHVNLSGEVIFKGPYIQSTWTHLQRVLGDDNVLLVKFAEEKEKNSTNNYKRSSLSYQKFAEDGISVGLRHYRFFVFKDGGKEEKKKNPTSSPVKCYFVRTTSCWARDEDKSYILSNKSISEARTIFMHVHTVSSLAKYMPRFSLILSKTIKLDVDLSSIDIQVLDDIPCRDEYGHVVYNEENKEMIHTDGTGFISEDLAMKSPNNIFKGHCLNSNNMEVYALIMMNKIGDNVYMSYAISEASIYWTVFMDRLLTLGDDCFEEKQKLEEKMINLVNLYYDALDAPKSGLKVEIPRELKPDLFPHILDRAKTYISKSILGLIYDEVDAVETEDVASNAVWLIPCFSEEIRDPSLSIWKKHYDDYRCEMRTALQEPHEDKLPENVIQKYKKLLYGAAEFEDSTRKEEEIFNDALAIYQIAYNMAKSTNRVGYCSFAWKVAGRALCLLHARKQENDTSILCLRSVLREVFG